MALRARLEAEEDERLAPWALRSRDTLGRLFPQDEHAYRTAFQRDRDRVLHSGAFPKAPVQDPGLRLSRGGPLP